MNNEIFINTDCEFVEHCGKNEYTFARQFDKVIPKIKINFTKNKTPFNISQDVNVTAIMVNSSKNVVEYYPVTEFNTTRSCGLLQLPEKITKNKCKYIVTYKLEYDNKISYSKPYYLFIE